MYHRWHTEINSTIIVRHYKSVQVIACSCIDVSGCNSENGFILTEHLWLVFFQGHMDEDVQAALLQIIRMRQGFVCWSQHTETTLTPIHHSHSNLPFSSVQFYTALEHFTQKVKFCNVWYDLIRFGVVCSNGMKSSICIIDLPSDRTKYSARDN